MVEKIANRVMFDPIGSALFLAAGIYYVSTSESVWDTQHLKNDYIINGLSIAGALHVWGISEIVAKQRELLERSASSPTRLKRVDTLFDNLAKQSLFSRRWRDVPSEWYTAYLYRRTRAQFMSKLDI